MTTQIVSPQETPIEAPTPARVGEHVKRLRKTAELSTTDLYQRRKRNLLLFGSVVTLISFTNPIKEIPVPLLNGELTLPLELAFLACLLTTAYFAWEFYGDWETARRKNSEVVEAEADNTEGLGSALAKLISNTSNEFGITALQMEAAITSIDEMATNKRADPDLKKALESSTASLARLSKEMPRWRRASESLHSSYTKLHESVSRLQQLNFYIDLVIATAVTISGIGASGYLILRSISLG